jgi:hypothetical protein
VINDSVKRGGRPILAEMPSDRETATIVYAKRAFEAT